MAHKGNARPRNGQSSTKKSVLNRDSHVADRYEEIESSMSNYKHILGIRITGSKTGDVSDSPVRNQGIEMKRSRKSSQNMRRQRRLHDTMHLDVQMERRGNVGQSAGHILEIQVVVIQIAM